MTTYQDNPPQYFSLTIPNNSVPDVAGYFVTVTDTGTTNIFRKSKSGGVFVDVKIGEIPKKGTFAPATGGASTEETQYFSGTLNATNLITNQAVPVVNRGIGGVAGGGNSKINTILGTNLADPPSASDPPPASASDPPSSEPFSGAELTNYTDDQKLSAGFKPILKYPLNQSSEIYDYIKIQPVEYVAGFNIGQAPTAQIESVTKRIKNTGIYPTIYLPMTPSISETNSVGWGADELNPVQIAFGQAAMNSIAAAGTGDLMKFATTTAEGVKDAVNAVTTDQKLSKFISAYFAGQAVQANLLGRTGIVINPNLELLFQGPKLRSFRYNFRFTPRDDKEAKEIRRIIRVFKKSMAPRRTEGSLFLGVPAVYEIKYIYNGGIDHPFLNKIKPCALTSFNINYAPDGSYMTYQDGSMTSYTVDMQFDELEPIYNEDISQSLESETMDY